MSEPDKANVVNTSEDDLVMFIMAGEPVSEMLIYGKIKHYRIAVNLHLRLGASDAENGFDGLAIFDVLKENKEDIEEAFGESFTWRRVPNFSTPGPLVGVYENITPDRDDWENQFEWMFTTIEALNHIFRKFVPQSVNTSIC